MERKCKDCPSCGEEILEVAKKCKHCGEMLEEGLRNANSGGFFAARTLVRLVIYGALIYGGWLLYGKYQDGMKRYGADKDSRLAGQRQACLSNLLNLATALEMYASDNTGQYPENGKLHLIPKGGYLAVIPTCPSIGADTYSPSYARTSSPPSFTVYCSGGDHQAYYKQRGFEGTNFPQYDSRQDRGLLEPQGRIGLTLEGKFVDRP